MKALISIVIPCYNAESSVLKSIRSLQNQTYTHWEAIVINDGSTDNSREVVLSVNDPRIRYYEFEHNRGRGAARQKGLEEAKGQYLAMVDADDWVYDTKLEDQLSILKSNPDIALISGSMAITNGRNELKGMRIGSNKVEVWSNVGFPSIPHGPSMIRMDVAKHHKYDVTMKYSQDIDFLSKCIFGKKYLVSNKIWYVYSEYYSVTKPKILLSYFYGIKYISRFITKQPLIVIRHIFVFLLKVVYLTITSFFISTEKILNKRSVTPTAEVIKEFEKQKNKLRSKLNN